MFLYVSYIYVKSVCDNYKIYAKIKDIRNKIVEFYDLTLILDCPIPSDLKKGQFIEFDVLRFDIYA